MIKMQALFRDGDQHIGGYGNPYLRLHGVLAGAKEHLDAQMLLDPFEKQFHLPTLTIEVGNQLGLQAKVVGQEYHALAAVVLDHDAAHRRRIVLARRVGGEHTRLVAQNRRVDPIHRMRIASFEFRVALGASHEEGSGLVNDKQPREIQIAPIHQIERTGLQHQIVHHIDLVRLAVGDVNEGGNIAAQVQQRVQLDRCLGLAKRRPREHRQTQVDGAGVEGIDRSIEFHSKGVLCVQGTCHANQVLREVGIDLPRSRGVCVGQRIARNRLATKPHVVQPTRLGSQVDLYVAQRLSIGQLGKSHGEELVQTREVLDLVLASVVGHATPKCAQWQIEHELREYELALVHGDFWRKSAKNPKSDFRRSNRDQTQTPNLASKSLTYDVLM